MSKIPLRAYVQEIESIIDQKQTEEAIAHCRHILQTFPKHIATYQMLGKAYLESLRYSNATDIFLRILSAVPDDFVSHVGMSIIREDENNLDAAIWHMERAFESQPYNAAIQGELRRLFGKRDGMEPPKIYLTRGALARMYAKGNLYQQAIAELRAAIAEEPQRYDLRVLLAQMYAQSGDQANAIETCGNIVSKLPYCLVANRTLAQLLEKTDRAKEAETYKKRLQELDPYEAFVGPNAPTADQVPAQAVLIEELVWDGGPAFAALDQPEWAASVGIDLDETALLGAGDSIPDWMTENEADHTPALPAGNEKDSDSTEDLIPDWMKEAGWGPSTGAFDESKSAFAFDDDEPLSGETAEPAEAIPGELPDWLQEIAPADALEPMEDTAPPDDAKPAQLPGWLQEAAPETPAAKAPEAEAAALPDWLQEAAEETPAAEAPEAEAAALPDWLPEAADETPAAEAPEAAPPPAETEAELPNLDDPDAAMAWLESLAARQGVSEDELLTRPEDRVDTPPGWVQEAAEETPAPEAPEAEAAALPDWIQETVDETHELPAIGDDAELPGWLQDIPAGTSESAKIPDGQPIANDEIPSWLQNISDDIPTIAGETEVTTETVKEPELSGIPGWMQDIAEEKTPPLKTHQEDSPAPPAEIDDLDAAMAWLESLAARQGVSEDELLTRPEDRVDTPPGWVQKAADTAEQGPGDRGTAEQSEDSPPTSETAFSAPETGDSGKLGFASVPPTQEVQTAQPDGDTPAVTEVPASPPDEAAQPDIDFNDMDAAMAWLESLAARQGVSEQELLTRPEDRIDTPPEWVQQITKTTEPVPDIAVPEEDVQPTEQGESGQWAEETMEVEEWLEQLPQDETAAATQQKEADLDAADAAKAWMESLAAEQDAAAVSEDKSHTPTEARIASPPDWVRQASEQEKATSTDESSAEQGTSSAQKAVSASVAASKFPSIEPPPWLSDGEIPADDDISWVASEIDEADTLIDLNEASLIQLERIPGVGFRRARAITSYRDTHGNFESVDDLYNVPGLDDETIEMLKSKVTVAEDETPPEPEIPPEDMLFEIIAKPQDELEAQQREAQILLMKRDIPQAIAAYDVLLQQGYRLDSVIADLQRATDHFKYNVDLFRLLGDACMRANRLDEALDAYTRAETLL